MNVLDRAAVALLGPLILPATIAVDAAATGRINFTPTDDEWAGAKEFLKELDSLKATGWRVNRVWECAEAMNSFDALSLHMFHVVEIYDPHDGEIRYFRVNYGTAGLGPLDAKLNSQDIFGSVTDGHEIQGVRPDALDIMKDYVVTHRAKKYSVTMWNCQNYTKELSRALVTGRIWA